MKQFRKEYDDLVSERKIWLCTHLVDQKISGWTKKSPHYKTCKQLCEDNSKALRALLGPCSFQKNELRKQYMWRILLAKPGEFLWIESGARGTSFSTNESDYSGKCAATRAAEICHWLGIAEVTEYK